MNTRASLYTGMITHHRLSPPAIRFRYRLFQLYLDLDRIDLDLDGLRLLSHNRFNLFSFHDRDHGPRDGSPLRPWIDRILADAGIDLPGGRVQLLCMPRVLGYGFNPLSTWYCRHRDNRLRAVLCEVRNTFGEWHGYLLHDHGRPLAEPVRAEAVKRFHVSPFFPVRGVYRFRLSDPGEHLGIGIRLHQDGALCLSAAQSARRQPLTDRVLAGVALRFPLAGLKVISAIHRQALTLWLRGARHHSKPAPPRQEIS